MATIFVSYRREDSPGAAGRLYDRLAKAFGVRCVFMDVDALPPGATFSDLITDRIAKCDALLAVIGRDWLGRRAAEGGTRLSDPNDFVRLEIVAALDRGIPVIPVLVEGASLPPEASLPECLMPLLGRQAVELRHSAFHADASRLVAFLQVTLPKDRELSGRAVQRWLLFDLAPSGWFWVQRVFYYATLLLLGICIAYNLSKGWDHNGKVAIGFLLVLSFLLRRLIANSEEAYRLRNQAASYRSRAAAGP